MNNSGNDRHYGGAGSDGRWKLKTRTKPEAGVWAADRGLLRTWQCPYKGPPRMAIRAQR